MEYRELCSVYEKLEDTSKRLEKTEILADFLKGVDEDELGKIVPLLQGRIFPLWDRRKLGFSSSYVVKALALISGNSENFVKGLWKETGDLGECAAELVDKNDQSTLASDDISVNKVLHNLRKLPEIEGKGSVDRKIAMITELLSSSSPLEAKFIIRTVLDELRIGLGEGTMRDSLVYAFLPGVIGVTEEFEDDSLPDNVIEIDSLEEMDLNDLDEYGYVFSEDSKTARKVYNLFSKKVQRAYDLCTDFGAVALKLKQDGMAGLEDISLTIGTPVKVMLALKEDNVVDAMERVDTPCAVEFKLDGFRLQIHKKGSEVQLFTRRLEDVTEQFPDVVEYVNDSVRDDCILDAEVVGVDKDGEMIPFQNISQRIRRKYDIEEVAEEFPVQVHVFDVLFHEGNNHIEDSFKDRRNVLNTIIEESKNLRLIEQIEVESEDEARRFYEKALDLGCEGVMFKNMEAPYKPGARVGYMVKMKSLMETLDLVIVEAEWGEGRRANWLSSYTLACRDEDGSLLKVGKVSTGLKEKEEEGLSFSEVTEELRPLIIEEEGRQVRLKPSLVIEVSYEEIQQSPTYDSGYALRFPRVVRLREDRDEKNCSSLEDVERLYEGQ